MNYEIHSELDVIIKKLSKKDKSLALILLNKIDEIKNSKFINHYKNLKKPLQKYKRVHITKRFVLIFTYISSEDLLLFRYFGHRDDVYKKKFD